MKRIMWLVGAALSSSVSAQPRFIARGDNVVFVIPRALAQVGDVAGFNKPSPRLDFDVRTGPEGSVEVFDSTEKRWRRDWRTAGFPSTRPRVVEGVRRVTRESPATATRRFIEYTLREPQMIDYRVFVAENDEAAIQSVFASVSAGDSIRRIALDTLATHFFTGPLEAIPAPQRRSLLEFANLTSAATRIAHETFKDRTYLVFKLPGDGNTWNDLRVSKNQRIGRLIEKQLPLLKVASERVPADAGLGLKVETSTSHGTAPNYTDRQRERVEAYFPLEALLKFANADITSQELLNEAIILVNGDRVAIDLSTL